MYISKPLLLLIAAFTTFAATPSTTTVGFQLSDKDVNLWRRAREQLGVVHLFRKGSALPCGHDIMLRVDRRQPYGVEGFLQDGRRFKPKDAGEALSGDPKVFEIPYDSGIWRINPESIAQTACADDLRNGEMLAIRARNGKLRIVYLDDGTTFWLKAEDSFPKTKDANQ